MTEIIKDTPPHLDSPPNGRARHTWDSPETPVELDTPDNYYKEPRVGGQQQRRIFSPESPEVYFVIKKNVTTHCKDPWSPESPRSPESPWKGIINSCLEFQPAQYR